MAAAVVGQTLLFVSGPLIARALGVDGRGEFAWCLLAVGLVAQLGLVGLPIAITHYLASDEHPTAAAAGLWSVRWRWSLTCVPAVAALGLGVLGLMQIGEVPRSLALLALLPVIVVAVMVQALTQAALAGLSDFRAFNLVRTLPAAALVVVGLSATIFRLAELQVLVGLYAMTFVVAAAQSVAIFKRRVLGAAPVEPVPAKRLYRFGAAALLGATNPADAFNLDQLAVGALLDARALGLYVVASSFANLSNFLLSSIGVIASPRLTGSPLPSHQRVLFRRYLLLGTIVGLYETVAVSLTLGWLVPALFGTRFDPSVPVARVLVFAGLFVGLRRLITLLTQGIGRPGLASAGEVCALVTLVLVLPTLVMRFGATGAAVAVGSSSAAGSLVTLVGVRKMWRTHAARSGAALLPDGPGVVVAPPPERLS